jgi:hypothetical protein
MGVLDAASVSCGGGATGTSSGTGGTTTASASTSSTGGTTTVSSSAGGTGGTTTASASSSGTGGATTASASSSGTGGAPTTTSASSSGSGGAASSSSGAMDAGSDADDGTVSTTYPAPHPTPPQVVNFGGPVLAAPRLVPVFFSGEDSTRQGQLVDFVSKIGATQYWAATTSEYGVGPATSTSPVALTEAAPATIDGVAIQTWLAGKLDGNDAAWPAPDANTVYILHYPAGTTVTYGSVQSCVDFDSYHDDITLDAAHAGMQVAYVVIPPCASLGDLQGLDATTATESHQLIEAATDPYPLVEPAYEQIDDAHFYWAMALGGGEAADLCAQLPGSFTQFAELPYTVQRSWSNKAALAGHDPCVPALANEVYFNTAPVLTDTITASMFGQTLMVPGAKIAVGASRTIELDLFSDGDTGGPWTVSALDVKQLMGQPAELQLSLDYDAGQNGQKQHLTITPSSAGAQGISTFVLRSTRGAQESWWFGVVGD